MMARYFASYRRRNPRTVDKREKEKENRNYDKRGVQYED